MKRLLQVLMALTCAFSLSFTALAASTNGKTAPSISALTNSGADITVSWNEVSWVGVDRYEIQLGKTNDNGSSFNVSKTASAEASESSYEFTVSQKGYYGARVRAKDVNGKYTSWSSVYGTVVVTSDDVSGNRNYYTSSTNKGPGVVNSSPRGTASSYVSGGPGVSGSSSSTGNYSSSSSTNTRKRVLVNTYVNTGWQGDQNGRWYLFSDGTYPVSCWERIDGVFYHFNEAGYMEWNRWIHEADGSWYFVVSTGEMATGWNDISGKWYYMDPSNGKMLTEGDHLIGGKWYHMNSGGDRVENVWIGGSYYGADGARVG